VKLQVLGVKAGLGGGSWAFVVMPRVLVRARVCACVSMSVYYVRYATHARHWGVWLSEACAPAGGVGNRDCKRTNSIVRLDTNNCVCVCACVHYSSSFSLLY